MGDVAADSATAARMRSQLLLPLLPLHVPSPVHDVAGAGPLKPLHPIQASRAGVFSAAGAEVARRAAALASAPATASEAPAQRFGTQAAILPVAISLAECRPSSCQRWAHLEDVYALDREIGRGHFGVVRVCVEKETGDLFACKSIAITNIKVGGWGWAL